MTTTPHDDDFTTDSAAMEARAKVAEIQVGEATQLLSDLADWVRDQQMRKGAHEYPRELVAAEDWINSPHAYDLSRERLQVEHDDDGAA